VDEPTSGIIDPAAKLCHLEETTCVERAFGLYPRRQSRVPHISLVFREMWNTAGLTLKPLRSHRSTRER
jgi:hypothetical protein